MPPDTTPDPATARDFRIGDEFTTQDGQVHWRVTDVGTRTLAAIKLTGLPDESWASGPPYGVQELVFDEADLPGLEGCASPAPRAQEFRIAGKPAEQEEPAHATLYLKDAPSNALRALLDQHLGAPDWIGTRGVGYERTKGGLLPDAVYDALRAESVPFVWAWFGWTCGPGMLISDGVTAQGYTFNTPDIPAAPGGIEHIAFDGSAERSRYWKDVWNSIMGSYASAPDASDD